MKILQHFFSVTALIACFVTTAHAQGVGADSVTRWMEQRGLFTPHTDDCTSSESFIPTVGSTLGFCMENAERSAAPFLDARKACVDAGKRLPEPTEFAQACSTVGTNLANMTNNAWEWASNFTIPYYYAPNHGVAAALMGGNGCDQGTAGWLANAGGGALSTAFRCVR